MQAVAIAKLQAAAVQLDDQARLDQPGESPREGFAGQITHDPRIALLSDFRIVMQGGGITRVLSTTEEERAVSIHVNRLDDTLSLLREKLRLGKRLSADDLCLAQGMDVA